MVGPTLRRDGVPKDSTKQKCKEIKQIKGGSALLTYLVCVYRHVYKGYQKVDSLSRLKLGLGLVDTELTWTGLRLNQPKFGPVLDLDGCETCPISLTLALMSWMQPYHFISELILLSLHHGVQSQGMFAQFAQHQIAFVHIFQCTNYISTSSPSGEQNTFNILHCKGRWNESLWQCTVAVCDVTLQLIPLWANINKKRALIEYFTKDIATRETVCDGPPNFSPQPVLMD